MADKRYEIKPFQGLIDEIPLPTTYSCDVKDKQTGNTGEGRFKGTPEAAERAAWQDLKEKQGRS